MFLMPMQVGSGKRFCATKEYLKQHFTQAGLSFITSYSVKLVYNKLAEDKPVVHWDNFFLE